MFTSNFFANYHIKNFSCTCFAFSILNVYVYIYIFTFFGFEISSFMRTYLVHLVFTSSLYNRTIRAYLPPTDRWCLGY